MVEVGEKDNIVVIPLFSCCMLKMLSTPVSIGIC